MQVLLCGVLGGIGRCGGGRYGGGHYGGGRYGRGRYGGASQKGVDATAEPPESSFSHYYGRYGGDTAESLQYNDVSVICIRYCAGKSFLSLKLPISN